MNQWRLAPSPVNGALSLLLLVLVSSIAAAAIYSGVEVAAGSLVRVMLFGITVYVFFYTASGPAQALNASNGIRRLYWIGVLSALFATVDFYFQFPAPAGYGPQFVWLDSGVYRRAQGVFYEAGTLGNLCAFFLIMIAVALSQPWTRTLISRKALAAGGCIFFAALVLSYSRSSLLNVMTALVVLAWLNRRRIRWARAAIGLSAGGAVAGVLTAKLFPEFFQAYWLRISASAEFFFSATEGVLSGRVATWYTLRDWILNHPWQAITGIGYKTLPYTNVVGSQLIGDNMYLTLLVETGVLGLAALLWLHAAILRSGLRAAYSDNPEKAFLGTWMVCFWSGEILQMLSVDLLTFWRVLPVYFWIFALAVRR
jgi:O-antigen ligase